ncbi:hypothetical protein PhCBS80983_g03487 [Powellomyces hirtus]|uniref:Tetratricopeptide repeat and J domain-containing co-chaperone DNJ1 n=1 Tax=Powellomyces hirtus TaxID=109895 RepID=A0A507E3L9_9FUNG|nr:hypothetical protein PhCBS80983_g03487 [Powellomyces hirtus]
MRNVVMVLFSQFLVCLLAAVSVHAATVATQTLLDQAKAHIAAGRYNAALDSFDAALGQNPDDHLTLFRRATVYLSLGRTAAAIRDFDKVLNLKPGHQRALFQRAKLLAKQGSIDPAIKDLNEYVGLNANDAEAKELLAAYHEAWEASKLAGQLVASKQYEEAIAPLSTALLEMPYSTTLRALRAECYLKTNVKEMAIADLTRITQIEPDNTGILMQLAQLHLEIGELTGALTNVKECLRLDQDHKECKKVFRQVKKLEKSIKAAEDALNSRKYRAAIKKLNEQQPTVIAQVEAYGAQATTLRKRIYDILCKAHAEAKDAANTVQWCGKVIEIDGENVDALVYRAEARMDMEMYEDAMRDFQAASQHGNSQRIQQGHQKAQRLHQQASRKDYYKILGVPRTASKTEIRKAYRKLTQQWHPDKYNGDLPKEAVEKKMGELNEAYTTLNDDALRARVDNGEDPNDANAGQGGHPFHGSPFFQQGGGFPFQFQQGHGGGSPFQFKFNFN